MEIEWLVTTNVTPTESLNTAENAISGVILVARVLVNSGRICGPG